MKRILYILVTIITIGSLFSCEPIEDRDSLPSLTLTPSDLQFSVKPSASNPNEITLLNEDPDVIPYWRYVDGAGNELGHSNKNEQKVTLPFAGNYFIYYTAFAKGGSVAAEPVVLNIDSNDESYFSDEEWNMLTNGVNGKTWVLDMTDPVGWAGLDYADNPTGSDYWNWFPDYASNSWVMPNKDWGEMHFDLAGNYNTSVTQTAITSDSKTTKKGTFSFDIAGNRLIFNGGAEMLYGGDYYGDCSNWTNVKVIELTAKSMRLGVVRDQSRTGEGVCLIVFHYKPKP